jgi:hypothetical protein
LCSDYADFQQIPEIDHPKINNDLPSPIPTKSIRLLPTFAHTNNPN